MVQGSRQEWACITSEQRTEHPLWVSRPRRERARYSAGKVPEIFRNKSGTAEDLCAFVSYGETKALSFVDSSIAGESCIHSFTKLPFY